MVGLTEHLRLALEPLAIDPDAEKAVQSTASPEAKTVVPQSRSPADAGLDEEACQHTVEDVSLFRSDVLTRKQT